MGSRRMGFVAQNGRDSLYARELEHISVRLQLETLGRQISSVDICG